MTQLLHAKSGAFLNRENSIFDLVESPNSGQQCRNNYNSYK